MTQPAAPPAVSRNESPPARAPVWRRPRTLGYAEALRGLGGIVSPLLAGFSLAAIATLATSHDKPPLAGWALAALAATVALLLFSMQVAFLALTQNSTPEDVLAWRPEATVSEDELQEARAAQAADFLEMSRLGGISFRAYGAGLIAFLLAVLLLMVPSKWSGGAVAGIVATGLALLLELWWMAANRWPRRIPHPVARSSSPSHRAAWEGHDPPPLTNITGAAVLDPDRREAAGLPRGV